MRYAWTVPVLTAALIGGMVSCGGGGSSSTPAAPAARTTGFAVPTEVSPVSTGTAAKSASTAKGASGFSRALAALSASIQPELYSDAGTDYTNAQTVKYVSEQSIDQFAIIETILNAVSQTHYADAANIGIGAYKSIVSWQQASQGSQSVEIQTWVVESSLITVAGQPVNQVNAWIESNGEVIRAQFKISASANQAADGSYLDYGVWSLMVKFDQAGTQYFTAQASVDASGGAVVALSQSQQQNGNGGGLQVIKAVLHKGATTGYGKVYYPNQSNDGNASVQTTASYVYNASQLLVHQTVPTETHTYQDRTASVPITSQYGLYDAVTGEDVMKTHHFGFPVSFTAADGSSQFGFYGANQGADQLWINSGDTIPDGTTVTRQDQGANGTSYLTASFKGTLIKRTYVADTISDLLNIPVQTNINYQHQLTWNGTAWMENGVAFTDFASLVSAPQKSVWINRMVNGQPVNLVYDATNASGAGFYPGTMSSGTVTENPNAAKYVPAPGDNLWANINGSIYIEYTGTGSTGWFQKKVTAFDQNTWTPTFDPNGDTVFTPGLNTQYFINNSGGNFVVTETALSPATYSVQIEVQTPVNPKNATSIAGGAATFLPQNYQSGQSSTYQFVTDPTSSNYLMLVYKTVGSQDSNSSSKPSVGDVVTTGQWGMEAYDANNTDLQLQYDWNYPQGSGNMGTQTFLYTLSGTTRTYTLLDNSIQLKPLTVTGNNGSRTLSLQYNGWMSGLPDYSSALNISNGIITADISSKIVNIPAATVVTDENDATQSYVIKPLQIGLYLPTATTPDTTLDITAADALDLTDPTVIPAFVDNGLTTEPTVTTVKYVDGVLQTS